ncbi:hypothetical protein NP493_736g04014 [Ridgeia piscesae]|uniref:Uncharacterized protein n=1 Tax=Ridgeia piscesae TaxID=27915 RepID=A0AAD9KQ95_RIDPI|nr:hypothetical protein NP493_736g04014 [Ridgeia piscesae]
MYEQGMQSLNKRPPFFLNSSSMCYRAPGVTDAALVHHDTMSPYKHQRPQAQSPASVSHANTYPYMQDQPRYALPVGAATPYDSPVYRTMHYQAETCGSDIPDGTLIPAG